MPGTRRNAPSCHAVTACPVGQARTKSGSFGPFLTCCGPAASRDIAPGVPGDAHVELTLVCQAYLGVARAYQGHADAALRLIGQAVGSARRLGDLFGLVFLLHCDAWAATVADRGHPGPGLCNRGSGTHRQAPVPL